MSKNDLDILLPSNTIALVSGEKVEINPFPFVKLPRVISLLNSIGVGFFVLFEARKEILINQENPDGTVGLEVDDKVVSKVNEFIETHFNEVVEVLSIYCRREEEFFLDVDKGPNVEEVCQIILTIVERHLVFFMKTLRPILMRIRSKAQTGGES